MKNLIIASAIELKLTEKHDVKRIEVEQCFANKFGNYQADDREEHQTDPATQWFVAPTNTGRLLKVIFVFYPDSGKIYIKSAYDANPRVQALYEKMEENDEQNSKNRRHS